MVLFLSGLLLWGPFGLAVFTLSTARFGATGMGPLAGVYLVGALFDFVMYVALAGGCLLAIYACIQKPWQNKPVSILFVLQLITLVGFVILGELSGKSILEPVQKIVRNIGSTSHDGRDIPSQFWEVMGAPSGNDGTRHPSDVEAARKMVISSVKLQRQLQDDVLYLLCQVAGFTDVQGLEFITKELRFGPTFACSFAQAAESAMEQHNYAAAAWLVDRADDAALPRLWGRMLMSVDHRQQDNVKPGEIDNETRALPIFESMLKRGLPMGPLPGSASLLHGAIFEGQPKVAALLLAHGADPNERPNNSPPLIFMAVKAGPAFLRPFLATPGLRLDVVGRSGESLMAAALGSNNTETLSLLLEAGVRFNPTALDVLEIKDLKLMQIMLDHGLNPRWRDAEGNTLLAYFYRTDTFPDIAAMLVKAGLPVNARNRYGATILNYVSADDFRTDARDALIALGARPGKTDQRLLMQYPRGGAAAGVSYEIRLQTGKKITGRTDIFGKTSWVPDGTPYESERVWSSP